MKLFCSTTRRRKRGFNLVEVSFAMGLISCTFVTLMPLLAAGLKTSRVGRTERAAAEIAETYAEQARAGTLSAGTSYVDEQGAPSALASAAFSVQTSEVAVSTTSLEVKLRIVPTGAPDRAQLYAFVLPSPPAN